MPAGDRTGPMGRGPMTGRAAGFCAGADRPGFANPLGERGFGGGGFGRRKRFFATGVPGWRSFGLSAMPSGYPTAGEPHPEAEMHALKQQAEALRIELDSIMKRLDAINSAVAGE